MELTAITTVVYDRANDKINMTLKPINDDT